MKTYFVIPGFLGNNSESVPLILQHIIPDNIISFHVSYDEKHSYYPNIEEIVDNCFMEFKKIQDKQVVFCAHSQGAAVLIKMMIKYGISPDNPIVIFAPMIHVFEVIENVLRNYAITEKGDYVINFKGRLFNISADRINSYKNFRKGIDFSLLENHKIVILPENETSLLDSHAKSLIFKNNTTFYTIKGVNHGFNGRDCTEDIRDIFNQHHIL